jgi:hypothetical protein
VHSWNFLPARGLDSLLGLMTRVSAKLVLIRALGSEPAVIGRAAGHAAASVANRIVAGDPGLFDELERQGDGPFSVVERAHAAWLSGRLPGDAREALSAGIQHGPIWEPAVIVLRARTGEHRRRIVAIETNDARPLRWIVIGPDGRATEDRLAALTVLSDIVIGGETQAPAPIDHGGAAVAAAIALGAVHLGELERQVGARLRAQSLRRVVLKALAREPGGPQPSLCDRADRLIHRTTAGLRSGDEQAVLDAVRAWRRASPLRRRARPLLDRIDAALAGDGDEATSAAKGRPRVVAILQIEPVAISRRE